MRSFMHVHWLGRGLLTAMTAAVVAVVMTASFAVPADAVRTKNRKSSPVSFLAPPQYPITSVDNPDGLVGSAKALVDNPPKQFKCYWIEPLHQYGCNDPELAADPKRAEEASTSAFFLNQALPATGNPDRTRGDDQYVTPKSFRCDLTGSDPTDPAGYSCAYRQGRRTVHFTLNEALTFEIRDTENPRGNFDSWFLPRPVRR
jgi:hypothetical protein